jgi:hypothetical protein
MADKRTRRPMRQDDTEETLQRTTTDGGGDELLADLEGDFIGQADDVGDYEASNESLPPDYEYRVSTSVNEQYGEYPYPGDDDLPLGYTSEDGVATEEGLSMYPPEDPATMPSDDRRRGGLRVATGFGTAAEDARYSDEERGDYDLAEELVEIIRNESTLTGYRLTVLVQDGVAYLTGVVAAFDDIGRVVSVVEDVEGIDEVVADDLDVSDEDIEGERMVISSQVETDGDLDDSDLEEVE